MKKLIYHILMVLAGITLTTTLLTAGHDLAGNWECQESGINMQLIETDYGFRTKFGNESQWRSYSDYGSDVFKCRNGSSYEMRGDNNLNWTSANGGRKMRFARVAANNGGYYSDDQYRSGTDWDDPYRNQRSQAGYEDFRNNSSRALQGFWESRRTGSTMFVQSEWKNLQVAFDGARRYRTFYKKRNGVFKDNSGNKIKVVGGNRLEWTSACGRYHKVYSKQSYRQRGHQYQNRGHSGRNRGRRG